MYRIPDPAHNLIHENMALLHSGDGARELHAFMVDVEETIIRIQEAVAEPASAGCIEGILLRSELLLRDVVMIEGLLPVQDGQLIVNVIASVVRAVWELQDAFHRCHMRGRPQIEISEEQLISLLKLQFSNREIARLLGVSPRTIRRRIIQFGFQDQVSFTDACLDAITQQFVDTSK